MAWAFASLIAVGLIPLGLALWANRRTSLAHALVWAIIAWTSWAPAKFFDDPDAVEIAPIRYVALCLTGCAGVAVLGARRPHVFAWNFVVLGLFAVMVWPMVETLLLGTQSFEGLRIVFTAVTIAVGLLNFVGTRSAWGALGLLIICEMELLYQERSPVIMIWFLPTIPWLIWLNWRLTTKYRCNFDRLWRDFRDRWGMMWSQRVREQFNHAADNAGLPVQLRWSGLMIGKDAAAPSAEDMEKYLDLLRAILQRFVGME